MANHTGAAVDATVIRYMAPQLAREEGSTYDLICALLEQVGIVVDKAGKIEEEWLRQDSTKTNMIADWVTDSMKSGRLRYVPAQLDSGIERRLYVDFGLPRSPERDVEYIRCANVTDTRYILSEDMDHFEPGAKASAARTKRRAKDERRGELCRFLQRRLRIRVGAQCHCRQDLDLA